MKKRAPMQSNSPLAAMAERIARIRAATEKAQASLSERDAPSMLEVREAFDRSATATLEPDAPTPRFLSAVRNKIEVEKLSRQGCKVAEIAKALGLSYSHVSKLRGELGVARRRR